MVVAGRICADRDRVGRWGERRGDGVGAARTGLLALYERFIGGTTWRDIWAFAWRTGIATAAVSAWWIVPLLVQSRFGVDFLRFTEQPGTIWSTTGLPESLRLMGYWISYLGVGYGGELRPYFGGGAVMLFALPVVIAGLLVPALALTGFAWSRKHRYGAFALGLVIVGLIAMTVGFPEGTPLRKASNFTYNHFFPVQFLRTTYKAGPLVALGVALLAGLAAMHVRALSFAAVGLALVACWPLVSGRALDAQLLWDDVPAAWRDAADHVDENAGDGRAVVLPGQLYAYYDWGGTIDPILPAIADKPVATRNSVGFADLHAVDMLWTVDALVEQRRALPGQLEPLLDLLGARTVLAGADDDRTRSGAAPAAEAADMLDELGPPDQQWGEARARPRAAGTLGEARPLPEVRAWDRPDAPGLLRVEPAEPRVVVDGSAEGVAALAAMGGVLSGLAYAGDLAPAQIARAPEVVITDSNRRRVLVPSRMAQNAGPVLAASEEPSVDAAVLNPFPDRGADGQTVAVYDGIESVTAPSSPGFPQFPERRPFAAIDGETETHWQADRALTQDRHTLEITFTEPTDIPTLKLLPYNDRRATVTAVEVNGRRFDVEPGWNTLAPDLRDVRTLSVRIADVRKPDGPTAGAGGIRELVLPGVEAREALRPPTLAERALPSDTRAGLTYLFQRTTGDDPFRRTHERGSAGAALVRDRLDGETGITRVFSPPAARSWTVDGWVSTAGADRVLDAFAGVETSFDSSGPFESRPAYRASSAFDGTAQPWIAPWLDGRTAWLSWTTEIPTTLTTLMLQPTPGVRRPTLVRLNDSPPVAVAADGRVRLPQPIRGREFRLTVLRAAFPPGTPGAKRQRRAVGIAEVSGPGVPTVEIPRTGDLDDRCFAAGKIGDQVAQWRLTGSIENLDAGRPLRVVGCEPISLPAGETRLELDAGEPVPYLVRLRSAGEVPVPASPGRVVDAGSADRSGGRTGIRLDLQAPARLVLAESYNRGRRATCDGQDLGEPEVGAAFGTAWRVPETCRNVTISFAPNRLVTAGYAVSAVVALVLLALLIVKRPPPRTDDPPLAGGEGETHAGRTRRADRGARRARARLRVRGPRHAALLRRRLPRAVARHRRPPVGPGRRRHTRHRRPDPHADHPARGPRRLQPRVRDRPHRRPLGRGRGAHPVHPRAQ